MYLTSGTLVPYLIDRGILSASEVLENDITVLEAGRRNRNFKITRKDETGIFVKQVPVVAAETTQSVQREATLYALTENDTGFVGLKSLMPRLRHYDGKRHLLAVDLVPHSQSLTFYYMHFSTVPGAMENIAAQLGSLLATCHAQPPNALSETVKLGVFPTTPPWILAFPENGEAMMPNMSNGARGVLAAIRQDPSIREQMGRLRAEWNRNCLIHGDLKWENFLVSHQQNEPVKPTVQLIDWELADLGDAAWDAACALVSFMQPIIVGRFTAQGQPLEPAGPEEIARAQACCRSFWQNYTAPFSLTAEQRLLAAERCARFAAARLVLTAYEIAQSTAETSPAALLAVRTAAGIFNDPRSAIRQLFALEAGV